MKITKNKIDRAMVKLDWSDIVSLVADRYPEIDRRTAKLTHDYSGVEITVDRVIPEPKPEPEKKLETEAKPS
jgi:hypothetical protein